MKKKPQRQIDKFKTAAREAGASESEAVFDAALRAIARAKPAAATPPKKRRAK